MSADPDCWAAAGQMRVGVLYKTPEAAAKAHDRAQIAVYGRKGADLNYPMEMYDSEVWHPKP